MMSLVLRQKKRSTQLIKEVLISYMVIRVGEIHEWETIDAYGVITYIEATLKSSWPQFTSEHL